MWFLSGVIRKASNLMRRASLFTIFLIVFIDLMGFGMVLPNLQLYGLRFGISNYFALTLIGATYSIFQFIFSPILGKWSDRIGRRPVLLLSQFGTLVGFLMLFAAHWYEGVDQSLGIALIFGSRIIDGMSGGNISIAFAYIADITTPENRAKGMGLIGAAFGFGFIFGPLLGGLVGGSEHLGLPYVPLVAAGFSVAALVMTFFALPESLDPAHKNMDVRRFSITGLRHALARKTIGRMIMMGFVNGFAFAGMEQTLSLLIKLRLFPSPTDRTDLFQRGLLDATSRGASRASGYLFLFIGVIMVAIQAGAIHRLNRKFGEARLMIAGAFLIALGLAVVGVEWGQWVPGMSAWVGLYLGCGLLALGSSVFNPSLSSLISRHAGAREQGEILGASQGMASLARALGPVLAGLLFAYIWTNTAWQGAAPYFVSAGMCLGVGVWAVVMRKQLAPPPPATDGQQPQVVEIGGKR